MIIKRILPLTTAIAHRLSHCVTSKAETSLFIYSKAELAVDVISGKEDTSTKAYPSILGLIGSSSEIFS